MAKFVDIACNLTDPQFHGFYHYKEKHPADIESVLERARNGGVEKIVVLGGNLQDARLAIELCDKLDPEATQLMAAVGVHPTCCQEFDTAIGGAESHFNEFRDLISTNRNRIVAFGEIGLDYDRLKFCPTDVQLKYFEMQLNFANEMQLPLIFHMRAACDDFLSILERCRKKWELRGGVCHSFTGSMTDLERVLEFESLFIGVNGCSLKTEENLDVIKNVPESRLLLETDAPWCEIRPTHASARHIVTSIPASSVVVSKPDKWVPECIVKGRNEPAAVRQVAEVVYAVRSGESCSVRDGDFQEFCQRIHDNTCRLFPQLKSCEKSTEESKAA